MIIDQLEQKFESSDLTEGKVTFIEFLIKQINQEY